MEQSRMSKRKELLIRMLKDPESEVSAAAATALEHREAGQGLEEILAQLKKGALPDKIRAIYALGGIGGEKVLKPLVYCASRPEDDLRAAAIDVLGTLVHRSTIPVLVERLKDPNSGIRAKAIKALGGFGDINLSSHLVPFLDAGDGLTDVEAVLALAKTGDILQEEKIMKLALSPLTAARAAAATALGLLRAV